MENKVKEKRLAMGLSQTQLACRVGCASSVLSNVESGYTRPWPRLRKKLAKALKTTEAELWPELSTVENK